MKPNEKATPPGSESVSLEFDLHHAPQKVWRALTDPALLTKWLLPVIGFELEENAAFTFHAPPQPGWDGTVQCKMLDVEAQRKLRWSWIVGDIDTEVTFELTPTDTGTRLSIVQTGFRPDQKQNSGGARYGWKMMGGRLVELLAEMERGES